MSEGQSNAIAVKPQIVFKYAQVEPQEICGLCGANEPSSYSGDNFYLDGTVKPVCLNCARRHEPRLADMIVPPKPEQSGPARQGECARYFAEAADLIRKARSLVEYKPNLSRTLEGYDRHLSRLAARFGCVPLRITLAVWRGCDTYIGCSQCGEGSPDDGPPVILRRNRTELFALDADTELLPICLACAKGIAPDLYAEWETISGRELEDEQMARGRRSLLSKPPTNQRPILDDDGNEIPF